jgi:hypothetical protein
MYVFSNRARCWKNVTIGFELPSHFPTQPVRKAFDEKFVWKYRWMASAVADTGFLIDDDVVVQCSIQDIKRKMRLLTNDTILLSVETNEFPIKTGIPPYINSGVIGASKEGWRRLWTSLRALPEFPVCRLPQKNRRLIHDQLCLQQVTGIRNFYYDESSLLVLNMYGRSRKDLHLRGGKWLYKNQKPCFIHSNGYKDVHKKICHITPWFCPCAALK